MAQPIRKMTKIQTGAEIIKNKILYKMLKDMVKFLKIKMHLIDYQEKIIERGKKKKSKDQAKGDND